MYILTYKLSYSLYKPLNMSRAVDLKSFALQVMVPGALYTYWFTSQLKIRNWQVLLLSSERIDLNVGKADQVKQQILARMGCEAVISILLIV